MKYFLGMLLLVFATSAFSVSLKVVYEVSETPEDAYCILGAQDGDDDSVKRTMSRRAPSELPIITGGDCFTAWTSGVTWSNRYKAIRTGKVPKGEDGERCNKQIYLHTTQALSGGRHGALENWDCTVDGGATCTTADGRVLRRCTTDVP